MNATATIVSKVWSFCTTLRDDGVSYGDYLEQLTYLIFLKMADEYSQPPYSRKVGIPAEYNWQSLKSRRGAELEGHYVMLLRELGNKPGMLGQIFTKAQNKIQDPAKLFRLIEMVNETQWVTMGADVKGDIYWYEQRMPDVDTLVAKLKKVSTLKPQPEVQVRGDLNARYAGVGKALLACQRAGIVKVAFITEPPALGG